MIVTQKLVEKVRCCWRLASSVIHALGQDGPSRFKSDSNIAHHIGGSHLPFRNLFVLPPFADRPSDFNADATTRLTGRTYRLKIPRQRKDVNSDALTILCDIYDIH